MNKILFIIICSLLTIACATEKQNDEMKRIEQKASEMRVLFSCSEVNVNFSPVYSSKGSCNTIHIDMVICDSIKNKIALDSLMENKIKEASLKAFSQVIEKSQFKFYQVAIYNDIELTEHVKAYNFVYDSIAREFKFYNNDLIP
jgi:hypothetical protein